MESLLSMTSRQTGSCHQRGFTTIEMMIVLSVAVVFLAVVLSAAPGVLASYREGATRHNMQRVADAVDKYALINYRAPCPSPNNAASANPPFGYEAGSGANGDQVPNGCPGGLFEGVVPYRTLGLPESAARDGWGRFMTYAVSIDFTRDSYANLNVHPVCRTEAWMYEVGRVNGVATIVFENRNPRKARFCCPQAANFIQVLDENNNSVLSQARSSNSPNGYATVNNLMNRERTDTTTANPTDADYRNLPASPLATNSHVDVVYALISHGANGLGALAPLAAVRSGAAVAASPEEENADGDAVYRDQWEQNSTTGAAQYDDIVFWKTQDKLMADMGDTCVSP